MTAPQTIPQLLLAIMNAAAAGDDEKISALERDSSGLLIGEEERAIVDSAITLAFDISETVQDAEGCFEEEEEEEEEEDAPSDDTPPSED